jgi:transketolase
MNNQENIGLKKISQELLVSMAKMLVPKVSHHIGPSAGIIDLLTYLYFDFLKVDPKKPDSPERDMFILSKGHAGAALYVALEHRGFFPKEDLKLYDVDGGKLPEHASRVVPGIELSTGSLGHGLPVGVGMALAARGDKIDKKVVVLMGDGELNEGSNWEAIMFAGHHQLNNLITIVDHNGFQGYSDTKNVIKLDPLKDKFESFGWNVKEIDGHDFSQIKTAIDPLRKKQAKPTLIIANTLKGKGISFFEGQFISHYKSLTEEQIKDLLQELEAKS